MKNLSMYIVMLFGIGLFTFCSGNQEEKDIEITSAIDTSSKYVLFKKYINQSGLSAGNTTDYNSANYYFEDFRLKAKTNYAINKWQIYDSIVYSYQGEITCADVYSPRYPENEGDTLFSSLSPSFNSKDRRFVLKLETKDACFKDTVNKASDKYNLSKEYTRTYTLFDNFYPISVSADTIISYKADRGIILTTFLKYGIQEKELFDSIYININKDTLVMEDVFFFENNILRRTYSYSEDNILREVLVKVTDRRNNETWEQRETFVMIIE